MLRTHISEAKKMIQEIPGFYNISAKKARDVLNQNKKVGAWVVIPSSEPGKFTILVKKIQGVHSENLKDWNGNDLLITTTEELKKALERYTQHLPEYRQLPLTQDQILANEAASALNSSDKQDLTGLVPTSFFRPRLLVTPDDISINGEQVIIDAQITHTHVYSGDRRGETDTRYTGQCKLHISREELKNIRRGQFIAINQKGKFFDNTSSHECSSAEIQNMNFVTNDKDLDLSYISPAYDGALKFSQVQTLHPFYASDPKQLPHLLKEHPQSFVGKYIVRFVCADNDVNMLRISYLSSTGAIPATSPFYVQLTNQGLMYSYLYGDQRLVQNSSLPELVKDVFKQQVHGELSEDLYLSALACRNIRSLLCCTDSLGMQVVGQDEKIDIYFDTDNVNIIFKNKKEVKVVSYFDFLQLANGESIVGKAESMTIEKYLELQKRSKLVADTHNLPKESGKTTHYEMLGESETLSETPGTILETISEGKITGSKSHLYTTDLSDSPVKVTQLPQALFATPRVEKKVYDNIDAILPDCPFFTNNSDSATAINIMKAQPDSQFMIRAARDPNYLTIVLNLTLNETQKTEEIRMRKCDFEDLSILHKSCTQEDAVKALEDFISTKMYARHKDFMRGIATNPFKAIPNTVLQPQAQRRLA